MTGHKIPTWVSLVHPTRSGKPPAVIGLSWKKHVDSIGKLFNPFNFLLLIKVRNRPGQLVRPSINALIRLSSDAQNSWPKAWRIGRRKGLPAVRGPTGLVVSDLWVPNEIRHLTEGLRIIPASFQQNQWCFLDLLAWLAFLTKYLRLTLDELRPPSLSSAIRARQGRVCPSAKEQSRWFWSVDLKERHAVIGSIKGKQWTWKRKQTAWFKIIEKEKSWTKQELQLQASKSKQKPLTLFLPVQLFCR